MQSPGMCFILSLILFSQSQSPLGMIRGTVTSYSSGARISHATVVLEDTVYKTFSDSNGVFCLSGISDGPHDLIVTAPGYGRFKFEGLIVSHFAPLGIDVRLHEGGSEGNVTVILKFSELGGFRRQIRDRMKFYQPDSTIDYKIRTYNPEQRGKFLAPDTSVIKK
jgi:hypothetical protein